MSEGADPTRDLEIVDQALGVGNTRHALEHLAGAFGTAPFDERVHAALERVAAEADVLAELPENDYFGTHVLRAHALHRAGRLDEAVDTLASVVAALPHLGLESVLALWLALAKAKGRTLGWQAQQRVAHALVMAGESTIGLHRLHAGERALLEGFGELADSLLALGPASTWAAAGLLRRVGRCEAALAALDTVSTGELEFTSIQRGLALRTLGQGARAAEAFAAAAQAAPGDSKYSVEQARCWFVAGDAGRALELLDGAGDDDPEVARLREACKSLPDGDRVAFLDRLRRDAHVSLEAPSDATANLLRDGRIAPGSNLRVAVSGWESPSNRLAVALFGRRTWRVEEAAYTVTEVPLEPDPLSRRRGAALAMWRREGGVARQAQPAPPLALAAGLARIAVEAEDVAGLWDAAGDLAGTLEGTAAEELAAAMVHPPADDAFLRTFPDGLFRHQVAGACAVAQLPWSAAQPILESLVFGPVDWTSAAAIVALGELARRDAERGASVRSC